MAEQFRALISASNFYRRKLCPGSALTERGMLELDGNDAQNEGVLLHDHEFQGTVEGLNRSQKWAIEKNQRLSEAFIARTFEAEGIDDPGECVVIKEHELFLCNADGSPVNPPVPGHTDDMRWYPKVGILFVFDSKFGRIPVAKAEINWQLRIYFVMANDEIEQEVKKTFCAIRQPFLGDPDDFHSTWYQSSDKEIARKEILDGIAACYAPNAKRKVSAEACAYCRAKGTLKCPESIDFLHKVNLQRVISMAPRELEKLSDMIRGAQIIVKGWKDRMAYIGQHYPGLLTQHVLGKQSYDRVINDPVKAFDVLYRQGVFGEVEPFEALQQFLRACCDASATRLGEYLEEQHKDDKNFNGKEHLSQTLGEQIAGEDDEATAGALITLKPRQRSLIRKERQQQL